MPTGPGSAPWTRAGQAGPGRSSGGGAATAPRPDRRRPGQARCGRTPARRAARWTRPAARRCRCRAGRRGPPARRSRQTGGVSGARCPPGGSGGQGSRCIRTTPGRSRDCLLDQTLKNQPRDEHPIAHADRRQLPRGDLPIERHRAYIEPAGCLGDAVARRLSWPLPVCAAGPLAGALCSPCIRGPPSGCTGLG